MRRTDQFAIVLLLLCGFDGDASWSINVGLVLSNINLTSGVYLVLRLTENSLYIIQ